jgi:N-acyl-D-amino-acid deacylase
LPAQFPKFEPETPFVGALLHGDPAEAKRLLAAGANTNEPRFLGIPPLILAVMTGDAGLVRAMADKGADIHATDPSGSTPLMWASANERGETAIVEELLRRGANLHAKNLAGETAYTWAARRGETPVLAVLRRAGANDETVVREAAAKAVGLLLKSSPQFLRVSGCVSCHHQSLPLMAAAEARRKGITVHEGTIQQQTQVSVDFYKNFEDVMRTTRDNVPDPPVTVSYALISMAAQNVAPNSTTSAMAQLLTRWQMEDGGYRAFPIRPPSEESHFAATALSLRGMQLYGADSGSAVARAAEWLWRNEPKTTEDRAMQLLGLAWAGAPQARIAASARALLREQRTDGGWGQLPTLETDAYATGQALVALYTAGQAAEEEFRRGISYLLRTQFPDGSWLVRTRAFPVQPMKESGFPHGRHQWISAAGTGWAAMALALSLPEPGGPAVPSN